MTELEACSSTEIWEGGRIDLEVMVLPDIKLKFLLTCVVQGLKWRSHLMAQQGSE